MWCAKTSKKHSGSAGAGKHRYAGSGHTSCVQLHLVTLLQGLLLLEGHGGGVSRSAGGQGGPGAGVHGAAGQPGSKEAREGLEALLAVQQVALTCIATAGERPLYMLEGKANRMQRPTPDGGTFFDLQ